MGFREDFPDVLAGARANQPWAFARFFHELAAPVAGYLRIQGAREPDDLTSQVFLEVFRDLHRFRGTDVNFRSWVFTIAHHRLLDERRRVARRPVSESFDPSVHDRESARFEDELVGRVSDGPVMAAVDELTADQRDVVLLRIIGELTLDETASALRKTPEAIRKLQQRGLKALRRMPAIQEVAR